MPYTIYNYCPSSFSLPLSTSSVRKTVVNLLMVPFKDDVALAFEISSFYGIQGILT